MLISSHPRRWQIAERDRLAAGSSWIGDDLFLPVDALTVNKRGCNGYAWNLG